MKIQHSHRLLATGSHVAGAAIAGVDLFDGASMRAAYCVPDQAHGAARTQPLGPHPGQRENALSEAALGDHESS